MQGMREVQVLSGPSGSPPLAAPSGGRGRGGPRNPPSPETARTKGSLGAKAWSWAAKPSSKAHGSIPSPSTPLGPPSKTETPVGPRA